MLPYLYGLQHGLGGLGFGMLHTPAWVVGSCSRGPLAGGTPQIQVHPIHVADRMKNLVEFFETLRCGSQDQACPSQTKMDHNFSGLMERKVHRHAANCHRLALCATISPMSLAT